MQANVNKKQKWDPLRAMKTLIRNIVLYLICSFTQTNLAQLNDLRYFG